jgi:hypothetical protein
MSANMPSAEITAIISAQAKEALGESFTIYSKGRYEAAARKAPPNEVMEALIRNVLDDEHAEKIRSAERLVPQEVLAARISDRPRVARHSPMARASTIRPFSRVDTGLSA